MSRYINTQFSILTLAGFFLITSLLYGQSDKPLRGILETSEHQSRSVNSYTQNYDIKYHRLEFEVDPAVHYINGMVCTYFVPLETGFDQMEFDFLYNMTVDSVIYNGTQLNHSFPNTTTLRIDLGSTLAINTLDSIKVYYQGDPDSDAGFGSFETRTTQYPCPGYSPVLWTLSEPYGSKTWWPCKETLDDKIDSVDIYVTCPSEYRVGSNGLLISEITQGNNKTYHWKHSYPIPAYLVAIAVSDYAVYSDYVTIPGTTDEIEILNYVYPCEQAANELQTPELIPIFEYFIETFGAYPYENEKYGHARCGFGGGMEHSTMSFMRHFGVSLMAHELAHQWFGNKITCGSWHDIWLNEAFATYLDGLTCEQGIGQYNWESWKQDMIDDVTAYSGGSTYRYDINSVYSIFNYRLVYQKGALLLHMLRWVLGDTAFFDAVHDYISDPDLAYDYAETNDLKAHFEEESEKDITEFLNDWLYGEGHPEYDVTWEYDASCDRVYIEILQTHSANQGTFFEMPVPIRFSDGTNDTIVVFDQNAPERTEFFADLGFQPNTATFDPERWLCATHTIQEANLSFKATVWNGNIDNYWINALNWDCGLPDINTHAVLPDGSPFCLVESGYTASCRSLLVDQNALLVLRQGSILNVEIP